MKNLILQTAAAVALLLVSAVLYVGLALDDVPTPMEAAPLQETVPTFAVHPVNAVLGNESFIATFGKAPTAHTSEVLRLKTHLAYVEGLLRTRDVSHLSPRQREQRFQLLDELRTYWQAGVFPRNIERPGRTPVFIDEAGRLCAVGYLIAQSAGRKIAERIDERYHLAHISEIKLPVLDTWAEKHGFTRHELAMIQPMYCGIDPNHPWCDDPAPSNSKMSKAVEIAGMGVNASAALLNGLLIGYGRHSRLAAGAGLVTGGAGLALGLSGRANYSAADVAFWCFDSIERLATASARRRRRRGSSRGNTHALCSAEGEPGRHT